MNKLNFELLKKEITDLFSISKVIFIAGNYIVIVLLLLIFVVQRIERQLQLKGYRIVYFDFLFLVVFKLNCDNQLVYRRMMIDTSNYFMVINLGIVLIIVLSLIFVC